LRHIYLPHIDGLRALAILAVVGFHAFPTLIPGGFIGVDIFFVISGYLISGILFRSLATNTFSIAHFYVRRVKRLFPALVLMLAMILLFGYFALIPQELKQLGSHATGGAGFISNLILWKESGYFDNGAETKPLLHLWSLSVEEQFYFVWPVFVFLTWKRRVAFVAITVALALASFAYNLANVQDNSVAAFYSPLSRFWELAVGGLLAFRHFTHAERFAKFVAGLDLETAGYLAARNQKLAASLYASAGVLTLMVGFFVITKSNVFPGWWAVLPIVGTVLLLVGGESASVNRTFLSHPIMRWLGNISYPLYLWHWPLLAYAQILQPGLPSLEVRIAAVVASVLLAWFTYKCIEKPIRVGQTGKNPVMLLSAAMVVIGAVGAGMYLNSGYPQREIMNFGKYLPRIDVETTAMVSNSDSRSANVSVAEFFADTSVTVAGLARMRERRKTDAAYVNKMWSEKDRLQRYTICHLLDTVGDTAFESYRAASAGCTIMAPGKKNVLVVGDSAAAEIYLALARAYPEVNFLQITGSACKPFHLAYQDSGNFCVQLLDYALKVAASNKLDAVVVASSWSDDFALALPELLQFKKNGQPLLVVGPPLMFSGEVSTALMRLEKGESLATTLRAMVEPAQVQHADAMAAFARSNSLLYLNRLQVYCEGGCSILNQQGEPLILDKFHLSLPGIDLLGERIKAHKTLEKLFNLH
jgi:peptidoglycan/LPS O-acetylase OafA/YrhL